MTKHFMDKYLRISTCKECTFMVVKGYGSEARCSKSRVDMQGNYKKILDVNNIPTWCPLPEITRLPNGTVLSLSDDRVISLYDKEGYKTGEINFGEKNVTFSGKMDKSSETLFSLLKYIIDPFFKDR